MKTTINRLFATSALMGAVFLSGQVSAQEVLELTLEESLQYALENNADAKNAQLEILVSKGVVGENRSMGLPQISGTFELTKNIQPPLMILPAEAGDAIGVGDGDPGDGPSDITVIPFAVNYQSSLTVNLEQMIFNGSYFVGLKAAKTLKSLTEYDKEKTDNDVIEATKKAYYTVLINKERKELIQANLRRVETLLRETEAMYDAGFAEKLDVSRIKVQLNNVKTELDKVVAAENISQELLKLQIGMPIHHQITVSQRIADVNTADELGSLLTNNGYRRVEIDQVSTNLDLAKLDLKNNQMQYVPTVTAFGTFQRVTGAEQFNSVFFESGRWFSASFIGVRAAIPIFDGLNKSYKVQQNRLKIKQLENQKFFMEDNVEMERFEAKTTLQNALNTLEVQKENMELAREVFDMTKIKYQEGVGSNLEVVEADSALKEAETNYFSALYDALIAKVDLEKALGIL